MTGADAGLRTVLMQETLHSDIERVFAITNAHRIHQRRDLRASELSGRARANFMRFFHRDDEALARPNARGKTERQAILQAVR